MATGDSDTQQNSQQAACYHDRVRAIRAFIFDLDGTLVDSLPDIADAADRALGEHGLPGHSLQSYRGLVGEGTRRLIERAIPEDRRELTDVITHRFREIYAQNLVCKTAPYPGITAAVTTLFAGGAPLAILSNKPHPLTVRVTTDLFGDHRFLEIHGTKDGGPKKPDPTEALAIAARLGIDPHAFALIGDTEVDIETAHRAGMIPVAVSWGYRHRDSLADAARILEHPAEIPALFDPGEGVTEP